MNARWAAFREYLWRLTPFGWLAALLLALAIGLLIIGSQTHPFNSLLLDISLMLMGIGQVLLGLTYTIRTDLRLPVWTQTRQQPDVYTWYGYLAAHWPVVYLFRPSLSDP